MAPLKSLLLASTGLASAVTCTSDNCEAGDQTALLQSHLTRKSELSLTSTGAAFFPKLGNLDDPHTRKAALLEMEKTAVKLASTQDPEDPSFPIVQQVCSDTANMLNATVLYAIIEEDYVDRQELQTAYDAFEAHETLRQAAEDAITTAEDLVQERADALTTCRRLELESCVNITECEVEEHTGPCQDYIDDCTSCDACSTGSAVGHHATIGAEATLCCIDKEIHDRWCVQTEQNGAEIREQWTWRRGNGPLFEHYENMLDHCESLDETCTHNTTHCDTVESTYRAVAHDCNTKQTLWQSALCQYHQEVSLALSTYQQGFLATLEAYNDIVARVMVEEADRKVEWEVLTRVICLLLSLTADDGAAGASSSEYTQTMIQACYTSWVDTTHLDIVYLPPPDMLGLPEVPGLPCDADYLVTLPWASPPTECGPYIELYGTGAESTCMCNAQQVEPAPLALGHQLLVDPSITVTIQGIQWTATVDGTEIFGPISSISQQNMPALTAAFFSEEEQAAGSVIAQVAWAYGSENYSPSGAMSLEERFAMNGGLLLLDNLGAVIAIRELAPSSSSMGQDVSAYMSFGPGQPVTEVEYGQACPNAAVVTDGWQQSRGAEHYCWVMGSSLSMCGNGCFVYAMAQGHIAFPLIEGLHNIVTTR